MEGSVVHRARHHAGFRWATGFWTDCVYPPTPGQPENLIILCVHARAPVRVTQETDNN